MNYERNKSSLDIKKRLTQIMLFKKPSTKYSFSKKSQINSEFLRRVNEAKRQRHKSLKSRHTPKRKKDQLLNGLKKRKRKNLLNNKENKSRGKSTFFNVYSFTNKNENNQVNKPRNENLERLFKRYKVSKREKKCMIYNSNQVDRNIESLIKFVDNKFHKADEFIKKHILKSKVHVEEVS
jgi:hypothetical protein